ANLFGAATQVVVPVGAPGDRGVRTGDLRLGPGRRGGVRWWCGHQVVVVVGPRLVVVGDGRQVGVGEDVQQPLDPRARAQRQPAALGQRPAALPPVLILVLAR